MTGRPLLILHVEDDPGDVDLTRDILEEGGPLIKVAHVDDGVKAMDYLRRQGRYGNAFRPDLILLDLNLPKKDGREVLSEIKADPGLKSIPVIGCSTSDAELDITRIYALGANCYITKPVGLDAYTRMIRLIKDFWFTLAKLPSPKNL